MLIPDQKKKHPLFPSNQVLIFSDKRLPSPVSKKLEHRLKSSSMSVETNHSALHSVLKTLLETHASAGGLVNSREVKGQWCALATEKTWLALPPRLTIPSRMPTHRIRKHHRSIKLTHFAATMPLPPALQATRKPPSNRSPIPTRRRFRRFQTLDPRLEVLAQKTLMNLRVRRTTLRKARVSPTAMKPSLRGSHHMETTRSSQARQTYRGWSASEQDIVDALAA
jgi:hypothetical protein